MNEEKNVNVENNVEEIDNVEETVEPEAKQEKMFSEAEVNAIVSKRLAKEKRKLDEAQRLASLSADERAREEFRLEKEQFEEERKSFLSDKMMTQCEKELISNGLPSDFAKLLVTDDADSTSENIKAFKEKWNKALEDAVNERLKANSRVPKKETNQAEGITWEDVIANPALLKKYNEQQSRK